MRALVELAVRQHRARPLRAIVVAAGVALATMLVGGILGGSLIAADLSQRKDLAALPDTQRAFRVTMLGTAPENDLFGPDRVARDALATLTATAPTRSVVLRETNLAGRGAILAAIDGVASWVAVTTGRLPRTCTPRRCEVVQVAGTPASPTPIPGAALVLVGSGRMTGVLPLGRDRLTRTTPLFVSGDAAGLSALPGVAFVYRSTIWTSSLAPDAIHTWDVDDLLADSARAARAIEAVVDSDLQLTGPTRELQAARATGRASGRRLALLGATGVVLVLAFAALAASMLRRDHDDDRDRLARRGATRRQLGLFGFVDRAWISLVGTFMGAMLGTALVAAIAGATDLPVWDVLKESLLSPTGVALIGGLWALCSVLLVLAGSGPEGGHRVGRARLADLVAVGAIAAAVLAGTRGTATADELASATFDPLLVTLPVLICLAAGAVALRLTGPIVQWCERRLSGRFPLAIRLAALAQSRRPRRVAMSAAFLVVATGLAIFATGYAATLSRGQQDQAAFVVPLDATVTAGANLVNPFDVAPLERYREIGGEVAPVIRAPVGITGVQSQPITATLLGVPAGLVNALPRWRDDASSSTRTDLVTGLRGTSWPPLSGVVIPADATSVTLRTTRVGAPIDLLLLARRGSRSTRQIAFGGVPSGDGVMRARVPAGLRGASIIAVRLGLSTGQQISTGHAEAEGRGGDTLAGTLVLHGVVAQTPRGPMSLDGFATWVGRGAIRSRATPIGPLMSYQLGAGREPVLRAPHPSDLTPVAVVVSSDIAERAGTGSELTIDAGGDRRVRGRIVASVRRFPTIRTESFAVADQLQLAAALDAADPGAGTARELWISRRPGHDAADLARSLARPPFASLTTSLQSTQLGARRTDPRARGVVWTLWAITGAALLLGVVALGLGTATDIRDERAELADLDAQGLDRRTLRAHLWLRCVAPLLVGTVGGIVLGVALATSVVRLVLVTSSSDTPVPPLVGVADWPRVAVLLAAAAVITATVVVVVTSRTARVTRDPGAAR